MNCSDWEGRVALYAGGDLDWLEASAVERHVGECAGCQILLSGLRESLSFLRQGHSEPIEEAHLTSVRAGVMVELRRRTPWWRQVWVYGAVAAAVLVFVSARPSPERPSKVAKSTEVPPVAVQGKQQPEPRPKPSRWRAVRPPAATETVLVKLETNNPDVVIYWISETKGETK
jgi:hypothetical protein